MANNIQFTSKDDVLAAYRNLKIAPWAIWCGKEINFSYSGNESIEQGAAELVSYLEMLESSGASGVYSLKVYDEDDITNRITSKTPYVNSFQFRLCESPMYQGRESQSLNIRQYMETYEANKLMLNELKAARMEIKQLGDRLDEVEQDEDDDDDFGLGKIGKVLQHPTIAPMAQQLLGAVLSLFPKPAGARMISGVPDQSTVNVESALGRIRKVVPDFDSILEILAQMAEKQPATLQQYAQLLKGMAV